MSGLIEHIILDDDGNVDTVVRCLPSMNYNVPQTRKYVCCENKGVSTRFKYNKQKKVFEDKERTLPDKAISERNVPKKYKDKKNLPEQEIVTS